MHFKQCNSTLGIYILLLTSLSILIMAILFVIQHSSSMILTDPIASSSSTSTSSSSNINLNINLNININRNISYTTNINSNNSTPITQPSKHKKSNSHDHNYKTVIKAQNKLFSIDSLKSQRKNRPKKCKNGIKLNKHNAIKNTNARENNNDDDGIYDLKSLLSSDHNWAPYFSRCNVFGELLTKTKFHLGETLVFSKQLAYIHVFKAGGTTIMHGISKLFDSNKFKFNKSDITKRNGHEMNLAYFKQLMSKDDHDERINSNNNNYNYDNNQITNDHDIDRFKNRSIIFTFVRDPIKKFLSAFFEINKRILSRHYNNITKYSRSNAAKKENLLNFDFIVNRYKHNGTLLLRHWIFEMYQRLHIKLSQIGTKSINNQGSRRPHRHSQRDLLSVGNKNIEDRVTKNWNGNIDHDNNKYSHQKQFKNSQQKVHANLGKMRNSRSKQYRNKQMDENIQNNKDMYNHNHINSVNVMNNARNVHIASDVDIFYRKMQDNQHFYINVHNFPNILFLNQNIKFDFIGNLDNLNFDLPLILKDFIKDEQLISMIDKQTKIYNDNHDEFKSDFMHDWFYQSRNRHSEQYLKMFGSKKKKNENSNDEEIIIDHDDPIDIDHILKNYSFEIDDLENQDIQRLCQIFWIDYLCFPFDLPPQCDLKTLFLQHFGNHMTYHSCYT